MSRDRGGKCRSRVQRVSEFLEEYSLWSLAVPRSRKSREEGSWRCDDSKDHGKAAAVAARCWWRRHGGGAAVVAAVAAAASVVAARRSAAAKTEGKDNKEGK